MSWFKSLFVAFCCSAIVCLTGCVGPMACGPSGNHGPIAFGSSCDGCGACDGCGEMYIDPWVNEPADCCDPCDGCGNHKGQSCGRCRSVFDGFATLWGYRCEPPCGGCGVSTCDGGCDSGVILDHGCDSGCTGCASCGFEPSEVMEITMEPTPAKRIVEVVPAEKPYQPHRTRKIFTPRPSIAVTPGTSSR